ncbi:MAG: hypothetical protein ACTH6Y_13865 [Vibrio hibernica]
MNTFSQEEQNYLKVPPHFRSFENTPIITPYNPAGDVQVASKAFEALKALHVDQVRTPIEKATIAKKILAEVEKAQDSVTNKTVKMTFEQDRFNDTKEAFLVGTVDSQFASSVVTAYQGTANKGLAHTDPQVMNSLNKIPLFMSGLAQEKLDSLNEQFIRQHNPELTRRKEKLNATTRSLNYADAVLSKAKSVASKLTAPLKASAQVNDNGFL